MSPSFWFFSQNFFLFFFFLRDAGLSFLWSMTTSVSPLAVLPSHLVKFGEQTSRCFLQLRSQNNAPSLESASEIALTNSDNSHARNNMTPGRCGKVEEGVDLCNHRHTVTIDTKAVGCVTHSFLLLSGFVRAASCHLLAHLKRKRELSRVKSLRLAFPVVGWRRRKKAWLSTAHFHRCLQLLELASWNTKVCSCSRPYSGGERTHTARLAPRLCVWGVTLAARHRPVRRPPPPPGWGGSS